MTPRWIALAAASLVLVGSGLAHAQSKLSLRLDYSLYGTHAAFYFGVDSGLYKAEGIELTIAEGSGSGTTAGRPSTPEPATTRNNSLLAARSRHPMQVRTGPWAGSIVVRATVLAV